MNAPHIKGATLLTGALAALVALAGCTNAPFEAGDQALDVEANQDPTARLGANRDRAWNDETFQFHAHQSDDPDGRIVEYRYDFGDGTEPVVVNDDSEVSHAYAHGGEFVVTLTVTDDGGEQSGAKSDTDTLTVYVNERRPVVAPILGILPEDRAGTERVNGSIEVHKGADRIELDLDVENLHPGSSTEIVIRLLGPDGELLDERTVNVDPDESQPVFLKATDLDATGTYAYELEATYGAANVEGELRVIYDAFSGEADADEALPENVDA